jgi:hypothetical protein
LSVLAGVISDWEKRLYRCDDSPNDGEQATNELGLAGNQESLEGIEGCDKLVHGVRSF